MTNEEIAVMLTDLDNRVKSLGYRMSEAEQNSKQLGELTSSVKVLATNMEYMAKEQAKQGERLERLEKEPADAHKYYTRTVVTSVITAVIGALLGGGLALIIK